MTERLVQKNGINRIEADSLADVFEKLDSMDLKDEDVLMCDLDGTVRRESWPRQDIFIASDEGKFIRLRDKALRWGVQHGMGIRKPDFVDPKIIGNIAKYRCRKAIVTDNTIGGHFVSQGGSIVGGYPNKRWFELAGKSGIQVFSQDSLDFERNLEKSHLAVFFQRNRYLVALLAQLGLQVVLGVAQKMGLSVTSPDFRYKAVGRKTDRGVDDIMIWVKQNERTLSSGKLIMVGDEESDFDFFEKVVERLKEDGNDGFEAHYFDVRFKG